MKKLKSRTFSDPAFVDIKKMKLISAKSEIFRRLLRVKNMNTVN